MHKANLSKELLSRSKLLKAKDFNYYEMSTNTILNDIFSLDSKNDNLLRNLIASEEKASKELSCLSKNTDFSEVNNKEMSKLIIQEDSLIKEENCENLFENLTIRESVKIDKFSVKETNKLIGSPRKFYKEGRSSLDNDFLKNYFAIDTKVQKQCDKELVDSLLNLLLIEPSFRTITIRIILANFENLVGSNMENTHLDLLNKIYYSFLSNIKLLILNNKYIKEAGYELFEIEWNNFKKEIESISNDLISHPYLIIPFNLEDVVEDYPNLLKIQKNEIDIFKNYLMIFMSIFELRYLFVKFRSKILKKNESIKERFPLNLGIKSLEIESCFNISSSTLEMYPCKLRIGIQKTNLNNYIMLIEQNYVLFCIVETNKIDSATVKYRYALRHLEVQIDRADPRILNLIVKDNKNSYIDFCLYLDEINKVLNLKRMLEEQRKSSRNTEFILLVSYFDDLLKNWNLEFNI